MRSLLRSEAREIYEANQEAAWRAFLVGQPCPVVVRVAPTFVPLGADVSPQKLDQQHIIRFLAGSLGDQPAYCVMVDDTPALEDYVATPGSLEKSIWDLHATQHPSPGPRERGTAYHGPVPDGYVLNPNSGGVPLDFDYDVATQADAARLRGSTPSASAMAWRQLGYVGRGFLFGAFFLGVGWGIGELTTWLAGR